MCRSGLHSQARLCRGIGPKSEKLWVCKSRCVARMASGKAVERFTVAPDGFQRSCFPLDRKQHNLFGKMEFAYHNSRIP